MNIFARSVFWAVPVWIFLMLLHYATWFLTGVYETVSAIIYPGHKVCLLLRGGIYDVDWFSVIVLNMVIYYLAIVLIVFISRLGRNPAGSAPTTEGFRQAR